MNRKNKFKIWNESLKKWVDPQVCFMRADGDAFFLQDGKLAGMAPHYTRVFSTGLLDKKGKEVWEGDIVKVHCAHGYLNNRVIIGQVVYVEDHVSFQIHYDITPKSHGVDFLDKACQVIGNVWENPELLK